MISERTTTCLLPHRLAVLSVNKLGAIINSKACLKPNKIPGNKLANYSETYFWHYFYGQHSPWLIIKKQHTF